MDDPTATMLISEAMQVPMEPAEREALIAALMRLGGKSALARWLAGVHQGLALRSTSVDASKWTEGGGSYAPAATPDNDTPWPRPEPASTEVFA